MTKHTFLFFLLLFAITISAQPKTNSEQLQVENWILILRYKKEGYYLSKKSVSQILQGVPNAQFHLKEANKYGTIRLLSFLSAGIGAVIWYNSESLEGAALGALFAICGPALGITSHYDYQTNMKKAFELTTIH